MNQKQPKKLEVFQQEIVKDRNILSLKSVRRMFCLTFGCIYNLISDYNITSLCVRDIGNRCKIIGEFETAIVKETHRLLHHLYCVLNVPVHF